jgi:hypothetical protein|tara:strand:- start:365 stop:1891 length:1527 start_codon:yes stop_codon:yes gene_type:complete
MDKFKTIFEGNNSAYGQLILTGQTTEKGKAVGKAFIKREPIPDQLWQDHIDGKDPALGVIPINENNECRWGCIDVDEYNLDHKKLAASIKSHKFPLVMFRSKSGGAHLFLFATEFIMASLMQAKLKMMSEALGFGGSEIFPKQTEILVERGDTGNFLNLPYHGGARGLRYAFDQECNAATLESFYSIYDAMVQTPDQVQEIIVTKAVEVKNEAFVDGPPCLNKLADDGFGEGSRNNALFNVAVYHKQANPDNWEDKVMEDNSKWMNPPLGFQEVKQLLASIGKRGYDKYRCKDQPICGVCNAAKCRTKKFGVGFEEEQMPELDTLTKMNSNPPQWFLNVGGKRIELKTEQLHNPNLFAIAVLDQANVVSPIPKAKDWREVYLKPLMLNLQETEPLESLDPRNQIENLLYDFTVHRSRARTKEDILNKTAWTDEGHTYFRMEDFYAFAKRNNWEMDKIKTGNLIKQLKGIFIEEIRMTLKNQTPRVVKIKSMKEHKPEVSNVVYQESPY